MRIKTGGKLLKVSEVINPPPSSAVFTATDQRDRAPLTNTDSSDKWRW